MIRKVEGKFFGTEGFWISLELVIIIPEAESRGRKASARVKLELEFSRRCRESKPCRVTLKIEFRRYESFCVLYIRLYV